MHIVKFPGVLLMSLRSRHPSNKSPVLLVTVTQCDIKVCLASRQMRKVLFMQIPLRLCQVMEDEVGKLFSRFGHLASVSFVLDKYIAH